MLTSHRDNKRKEDLLLERDLKEKRNVLKDLKHKLKEKETTAYLESSRRDTKVLKVQIESIQEEINCISQKRWGRKPEFSDDTKKEFK